MKGKRLLEYLERVAFAVIPVIIGAIVALGGASIIARKIGEWDDD